MKILFFCLILLINVIPTKAEKIVTTTTPYYYNNYYPPKLAPSWDFNALEKYALNKTYSRENDIKRLERLENLAFGATQNGNPEFRYRQVEEAILSRPKYNAYQRSLKNRLGQYISGQSTGITPSIVNQGLSPIYNNGFTPQYSNSNFVQYSSVPFGWSGHQLMNSNYGTNSGIRILP